MFLCLQEWNLDFKEIVDEDLIGVQLYRHRILDKTFEVVVVRGSDVVFNMSFNSWLSRKVEEAEMSEKHIVYLQMEYSVSKIEAPNMYIFSICWGCHILIWCTFCMQFEYCLDVLWLLMVPNMVVITDKKSENLLANYFGLHSKNTVINSVSKVYKERMLKAKREARRLKSFGHGIAVDIQLRCLKHFEDGSSSDEELSLHELCTKILGLHPPDTPTMPDLSMIDVLEKIEIPRDLVENCAIKVSLLPVLMSSLGF